MHFHLLMIILDKPEFFLELLLLVLELAELPLLHLLQVLSQQHSLRPHSRHLGLTVGEHDSLPGPLTQLTQDKSLESL